jgi:hypothetical protein
MRAMFYRCVRVIEQALSARREYTTKDGQIVDGGPDQYARLAATKHFRDFITLRWPAPKQPENQQQTKLTVDELRQVIEANARSREDANAALRRVGDRVETPLGLLGTRFPSSAPRAS